MGFFDSPDEKLRKKVSPEIAQRASILATVVEHYGENLNYHHRAELVYVVSVVYIRHQIQTHGMDKLHNASLALYANCVDQAKRISGHFTPEQRVLFDISLQHIEALPETFDISENI